MQPATAVFRQSQLNLRAQIFRPVWQIYKAGFDPSNIAQSWGRIEAAINALTVAGFTQSATQGGDYYAYLRLFLGAEGPATIRRAVPNPDEIAAWLEVAGPQVAGIAGARGDPDVFEKTFVSLAGSVQRNVFDGGRSTILDSVTADDQALGWARVTGGDPCAFCAMLASRGHVYKSEMSAGAGEEWHLHCACEAEPVYSRDQPWPGRAEEFREMWNEHPDLNEFRQLLEGGGDNET